MALNENIKTHLRENLSKNIGGGLHLKSANAKLIDTPILVIGLGGTGAESLIRLKHMVNERLNSDFNKDKPSNIEYLAIDTDPRTKTIQYNSTFFSEAAQECYIMEDAMLAQTYKNLGTHQMPHVKEWISNDINVSHINNGAGGIRQIGRFLFFKEFQNVLNNVKRKMIKITSGRSNREKAYVFITTGVSGGTGSGTFIDIPYIIRKIFSEISFNAQIIGFIFLPDVNLIPIPLEDNATRLNIQRNGFAALKELDYLMNLGGGGNKESFEQDYGNFKVSYDQAPYDICHLVSSINRNGVNNYTKDTCMLVAAETIINFIADEPNKSNEEFTIAQYLSNIVSTSTSFNAELSKNRIKLPINYKYNAIGSSSGVLPMDDVLNYLTHLLFKQMQEIYNKIPTKKDVMSLIEQLKIGINSIELTIKNNISLRDITLYNYNSIKSDPMIVEKILSENLQNTLTDIMENNLVRFIEEFETSAERIINTVFIDFDKGPSFATRLINSTEEYCVLKYIKEQRDGILISKKISDAEIGRLMSVIDFSRNKIINYKPILGFNKDAMIKEYKDACNDYYQAVLQNKIIDKMTTCYDKIEWILNNNNNKVFTVFTEMISVLRIIFEDYAGIANETKTEKDENETIFTWNIIDTSALIAEVELLLHNEPDFKINYKDLIRNFMIDLIENSAEWLNKDKPSISVLLNKFIINNFSQLVNQSIDFYIKKISEGNEKVEKDFISNLLNSLIDKSKVMFPLSVNAEVLNTPVYKYFSMPYNSESFDSISRDINTIKRSIITNRIFMLNVNLAYPLMAYRELEQYEDIYESFVGNSSVGMHLYQSENRNWQQLPSPIAEKGWSSGYVNIRQKKINERVSEIFDKGILYEYIVWDSKVSQYFCLYTYEKLNINMLLNKNDLPKLENIRKRPEILSAISILKSFLNKCKDSAQKTYLYDIQFDDNNDPDVNYSKGIFVNMPELNQKIDKMIVEHETLINEIKKLEEKNKEFVVYPHFALCLYTNSIRKERANYVYTDQKMFQKVLYTIPTGLEDTYYEYYLFDAFRAMDKEEREQLSKKAEKYLSKVSDEELDRILENMKKLYDDFTKKRSLLEKDYNSVSNGIDKADFYNELKEEINKTINIYS